MCAPSFQACGTGTENEAMGVMYMVGVLAVLKCSVSLTNSFCAPLHTPSSKFPSLNLCGRLREKALSSVLDEFSAKPGNRNPSLTEPERVFQEPAI